MTFLITIVAFVAALGLLITFHELGHFLVARWCGVKVLRFSVGFGAPLWGRRFGPDQTEWAVGAIPLGGYVKMLDEREAPVAPAERHRAFNVQNVWKRIAIVAAGPLANFLLAILLYWILLVHGIPGMRPAVGEPLPNTPAATGQFEAGDMVTKMDGRAVNNWQDFRWQLMQEAVQHRVVDLEVETLTGKIANRRLDLSRLKAEDLDEAFLDVVGLTYYEFKLPARIGQVTAGEPAAAAGLRTGDEVISVNGQPIERWDQMVDIIKKSPGVPVTLEVERAGGVVAIAVTPATANEKGKTFGRIGVGMDDTVLKRYRTEVRYGPLEAVSHAVIKTWNGAGFTLKMMWKMVVGEVSVKNLSGPLTIADYAGQSAQMGFVPFLTFLALISIGLGVLNLLPVPLLDGGHLLYYSAEIIKGSPVSDRALEVGQRIGMILLFSLMAFALYNDINRLVGGS